nr:tudor and KH domain-containing protein isoform X3 [Oncorhynchus gorbuscha]XP_046224512.1 tudor and KH domain-containing protein isoform X3 [Oncorhynchus gorbuscha]XP_046224513.1 tudor and KH domain-containing protein isoform X3 [Oncorhynchus gorbuscha]
MEAVREGPKSTLSSGKVVALAAGLSVGATVGYIVYRQIKSTSSPLANTEESRMSVPLEVYRTVTKYQASFLDLVMQKSGAHVRVLSESSQAGEGEQSSQNSVCFLLQGSPQQVLLARCSLENLAADCETTTDVMEVPQTAFGRIIGRGGESLKLITRTTGARVLCPRERGRGLEKGVVSVTGTRLEVRRAKELILEKVFEDEAVRRRITQSSALRQKRRPFEPQGQRSEELMLEEAPQSLWMEEGGLVHANGVQTAVRDLAQDRGETVQLASEAREEDDLLSPASLSDVSKFEIPSPDLSFQPDEHLEVYVSASENPHHFWIQILGVRSLQLDKLTAEMSRFYSNGTLQEQRVETVVVGDIVAAPYRDYGTWNRARVLGVMGSGLVDLYYVDFGDNGELPRDSLRSMRSDFLSLPFQAIECSLAGVNPAGEVWSDQALDDFERLTHVAEWKPLLAKLCSYTHSEVSSWPSVQLYDNTEGKAVDLGEEMVSLGHAVPSQDNGNGGGDRDDPGTLQRMLDDVTGATSELSLSCISLSGVFSFRSVTNSFWRHMSSVTGHQNEEWVLKLATPSFSGSLSPLELQRADVDDSPSGFSFGLTHSTPAQQALVDLVSHILESPSPSEHPLSPDHQVPGELCHTLNRTTNLYSFSVPQLQLTHTLPLSSCTSSSTSSSPLEVVTSVLGSVMLSDNVFLEGSSYDGDEECGVTSSSGEVETTGGNSTWWSTRGDSLEEEVDEEQNSEGAIDIGSTPTFPTQRHLWLEEGSHGGGEDSTESPSVVVVGSSSSSFSSCGSDIIYMGSVAPAWEKGQAVSCPNVDGGNPQRRKATRLLFHLSEEAMDMNALESQAGMDEKTEEQRNRLDEHEMEEVNSPLGKEAGSEHRNKPSAGFHSPEVGTESGRLGIAERPPHQRSGLQTSEQLNKEPNCTEANDRRASPQEL